MWLNEGVVDRDDVDVLMLDPAYHQYLLDRACGSRYGLRIAENDTTNAAETVDADLCPYVNPLCLVLCLLLFLKLRTHLDDHVSFCKCGKVVCLKQLVSCELVCSNASYTHFNGRRWKSGGGLWLLCVWRKKENG